MALGISAAGWTAIAATSGSLLSANSQKSAGNKAAGAIADANQQGITGLQDAQSSLADLLAPYITAGTSALTRQQDLLGLNGNSAEQKAIQAIQSSPLFASALQQGEKSILSNAAATGGLRGGNVQSALAQFSPQLLSQLINQQYGQLGSMSSQGLSAAGTQGASNVSTASAIAQLLQNSGQAQAGAALNSGKSDSGLFGSIGNAVGSLIGGLF